MPGWEGLAAIYGAVLSTFIAYRQFRKPLYINVSRSFRFVQRELEWSIFLSNIGPAPTTIISVEFRNYKYPLGLYPAHYNSTSVNELHLGKPPFVIRQGEAAQMSVKALARHLVYVEQKQGRMRPSPLQREDLLRKTYLYIQHSQARRPERVRLSTLRDAQLWEHVSAYEPVV
jgi:hypothetical protein